MWEQNKLICFNILFLFPVFIEDYVTMMSETVTFDSCDAIKCIGIEIVNDTIVEDVESFTVTVDSPHDRIMSDPAVAVVTITDDDCEFIFHQHYKERE